MKNRKDPRSVSGKVSKFLAFLLFPLFFGPAVSAQVHPSTLPDIFLGVYPTSVDRINCDMLKTGSGAADLLYVIAWDDKATGDAYVYISDGTNSHQVTITGAAKPDVVLGVSTSGNYMIGVAYESGSDVYVRSYAVTISSGPTISSILGTAGPLNINAAGEPHIDLWLDNTNTGKWAGLPTMYEFAAAWHEWNGSTQYEVNALYGQLSNPNINTAANNPIAADGVHSDISAFDDIVAGRFFAITYTDNAGDDLYAAEYDFGTSSPSFINLQTGADIYNPRIESPSITDGPGLSYPHYVVAASIDDYTNPRKIVAYADWATSPSSWDWTWMLGNSYNHHMPAIGAGPGPLVAGGPFSGAEIFAIGFYPSGDTSLYCTRMQMAAGPPVGGQHHEVNAGSLSIAGMPAVAVSSCSNWGNHTLAAYFDGSDIVYKITQSADYHQFKTTSISGLTNNEISLYPNPASNTIYLEGITDANYSILDITGRQLLSGKSNNGAIDISSLSPGMYMIQLTGNGQAHTLKFAKQ